MMNRKKFVLGLMASGVLLVSVVTISNAGLPVAIGKYNKPLLRQQLYYCHDDDCPACMYNYFPDLSNPFGTSYSNCEGMTAWTNPMYHWLNKNIDWESFVLIGTQKSTLEETVNQCMQNYLTDTHCTWTDPFDNQTYEFTGGYLLGSELAMESLDAYIDRWATGWPSEPNFYDWSDLHNYLEDALANTEITGLGNWGLTFYASLAYYADAVMESVPASNNLDGLTSTNMDVSFAAKCTAHALVCWQGSEWENGQLEFDLLTPSGIAEFPFAHEGCPTFVFQMADALADIFSLPVANENVSFGTVKVQYR